MDDMINGWYDPIMVDESSLANCLIIDGWYDPIMIIKQWAHHSGANNNQIFHQVLLVLVIGELPTNRGCGLVNYPNYKWIKPTYPIYNWGYNPLTKWEEPPSTDYWFLQVFP